MAFHASPFGAETVQLCTFDADQFTFVVSPLLTSEGTTDRVRSGVTLPPLPFWSTFVLLLSLKVPTAEESAGAAQLNESVAQPDERPLASCASTLTVFVPAAAKVRDAVSCRSACKTDPPSARDSAKPSGATLRCAPPRLALRRHNLEGGQLFDADPGQLFGAV